VLLLLTGCANLAWQPDRPRVAYLPEYRDDVFSQYMPIIVVDNPSQTYNQIGYPVAAFNAKGEVDVSISTDMAVAYVGRREFRTKKAEYTNLIYRIHFQQVPFSLLPFNLTAGNNVGLIFIVTLNSDKQAVLLTTVHTCGCFVAVVPTDYLAHKFYPKNWSLHQQTVFGAQLPGVLQYPRNEENLYHPVIYLGDATHRVIHIDVQSDTEITENYVHKKLQVVPLKNLENLQLPNGETVSLFEEKGLRIGYVKGSLKPFEFLFMSWWAFDARIGEDKMYGDHSETGTVFYTSLKPWARQQSDMWDFSGFLEYWGWNL